VYTTMSCVSDIGHCPFDTVVVVDNNIFKTPKVY
jgi:hypothetical protein